MNLYGFAGGDPINFSDLFGLCPACAVPAVIGATELGAAAAATVLLASSEAREALAVAFINAAAAVRDKVNDFKFVTYTRTHPVTGQVYSGRTSGFGSPEALVAARAGRHPDRLAGFGPAVVDRVARGDAQGYMAVRGREQQLIDAYGRAQSEGRTSANRIRAVAKPVEGPFVIQANNPANWIRR